MSNRFNINKEKISNSILFTLEKLGGTSDLHKVCKILYFADQKHLTTYGFPITGDFYLAMKNGPVPFQTFNFMKSLKGEELFDVQGHYISAKSKADMEELAQSDIECLSESINENKDLNFGQLTQKSHKQAWEKADCNDEISVIDIAEEANVDAEMKKYILLNLENQQSFTTHAKSW
jgi:uncharacterized phage-associated protein